MSTKAVGPSKSEEEAAKWKAEATRLETRLKELEEELKVKAASRASTSAEGSFKSRTEAQISREALQSKGDSDTQNYILSQVSEQRYSAHLTT